MKKSQLERDKEFQQMQVDSEQLRKWSIQKAMTPAERYKLGPTDTWHTPEEYYRQIIPRWCPLSTAWSTEPSTIPQSIFMIFVRGGIVDTNFISIRDYRTGAKPRVYVHDSQRTREVITRLQSYPIRGMAYRFVKTRLIQETFKEGWLEIFKQAETLKRKLNRPDWRDLLTGRMLNLNDHIKVGKLIDSSEVPIDLMPFAMRLITVWIQDYLNNKHPEKGVVGTSQKGLPLTVILVYGQKQLVSHQQIKLTEFYRANLDRGVGSFKKPKTQLPLQGW